jgi:uncharacterized protein (TIGR02466 family)
MDFYQFGPPLAKTTISEELRLELLEEGKKQTEDAHPVLVGHMEDEKMYNTALTHYFENKISKYIIEYIEKIQEAKKLPEKKYKIVLKDIWINIYKTGEHNPPHNHPDGQISFVIYLDFPDVIKKEIPRFGQFTPGSIQFIYGSNTNIQTDFDSNRFITKVLEPNSGLSHVPTTGEMFIFPSYLMHFVSPFYTEGVERISVAGNISVIDVNEKKSLL